MFNVPPVETDTGHAHGLLQAAAAGCFDAVNGQGLHLPPMEGPPMTFEASITTPGGGVTARLEPSLNRVEIETHGTTLPAEITAALPKVLQHLADRSRLPVRRDGMTFYPRPMGRLDADLWGDEGGQRYCAQRPFLEPSPKTITNKVLIRKCNNRR
jgi:hypothetical protein